MDSVQNVTHRLNEFFKHTKLSMIAFSTKTGINNSRLAKAISKEADFGISIVEKIAKAFPELNPSWLITGKGEMLLTQEKQSSATPGNDELQKQLLQVQSKLIACMEENDNLKKSTAGTRRTTPA